MAEKHVHKVYGSFPPWGKSVEFPANGGGGVGEIIYVDVTNVPYEQLSEANGLISVYKGYDDEEGMAISPTGLGQPSMDLRAVGFVLNLRYNPIWGTANFVTVGEALREDCPWILELPRLTEEEFYSI